MSRTIRTIAAARRFRSGVLELVVAAGVAIAGFSSAATAHHGNFTFDVDTVITVEGVVTEHDWTNPHSAIHIEATDADGATRSVVVEADGASLLRPLGVTRESIQPGERIVVTASPSRREGSSSVLGREIIKADGSVVRLSVRYAREIDARPNAPASSVLGTWVPERGALFEYVQRRDSWALTEAGRESLDAYDTAAPFAHAECIAAPAPTLMVYPSAKVLHESGDRIVFNADWMGAGRVIHMDAEDFPADLEPTRHGYSVGRWQDDTLVVETRGFTENPIGNAFGVASSREKRLRERFTLADDGFALEYTFELEDPVYLSEPVRGSYRWNYRPDTAPSDVECELEAASRYLEE